MSYRFLKINSFLDAAPVLNCETNHIPARIETPFEVVASLSKTCQVIEYIDTTAQFIEIYVGEIGNETLVAVVGGGCAKAIDCLISKGERISLRSFDDEISTGAICLMFMGPTNE